MAVENRSTVTDKREPFSPGGCGCLLFDVTLAAAVLATIVSMDNQRPVRTNNNRCYPVR